MGSIAVLDAVTMFKLQRSGFRTNNSQLLGNRMVEHTVKSGQNWCGWVSSKEKRLIALEPATVGFLLNWWRRSTNPSQAQIHCLHFSLLFAAYITDDQPIASNSSWHVERIHIVCCVYTWIFAWIDCVRIWRKNIYGLHATCGKWAECVWIWLMDIVLRTHTRAYAGLPHAPREQCVSFNQ